MQEQHGDQPPSLSQLLRESYLAEARAQQRHSEMSRSDACPSRRLVYGPLKGKVEDPATRSDPRCPDLSAFLSQEELDKSVDLARQAIGHDPRQERAELKAPIASTNAALPSAPAVGSSAAFPTPSPETSASFSVPPPTDPLVPVFTAPSAVSSVQKANKTKEPPPAERKTPKASAQPSNGLRNSKASGEAFGDFSRSTKNAPYGVETQSKKEFLNKAADFIEELSSLFKANSSKRVRPRACKAHRSASQNKGQNEGAAYALEADDRERPVVALELEEEMEEEAEREEAEREEAEGQRPSPASAHQPHAHLDSRTGLAQPTGSDYCIAEEQQHDAPGQETEEAESPPDLADTPYSEDAVCEPPHFIQKLKSREVPEGRKVQLDCIVRGLPVPEVRWFCEGKELEDSPDVQIVTNGELHSLIIAEAFEEDTGRYSCFASNFYGTDSTSAEIYIEGASSTDSEAEQHPDTVAELQRNPSELATTLATALLPAPEPAAPVEAEDAASPQLPVTASEERPQELPPWTPNAEVTPEPPVPETPRTPKISTPHVPEEEEAATVTPAQRFPAFPPGVTGPQEVQEASAPEPVTSTTYQQPIQTPAELPSNPTLSSEQAAPTQATTNGSKNANHSYLQGLNGRPIMAAPVFTKSLQDLMAFEGQLVVLECRVKGAPAPRVEWYREGTLIEDSPDFRILQKKEICTLVIAEVFPEDSGMFTCTASNNYGTVSSIAALTVKGNGLTGNQVKTPSHVAAEPVQVQESPSSDLAARTVKPEVLLTNSVKPHSSTIRLDPLSYSTLCLDPLSASALPLDPHSSSVSRTDPLSTSLPVLDPQALSGSYHGGARCVSTPRLDPIYLSTHRQDLPGSGGGTTMELQSSGEAPSYLKPFSSSSVADTHSSSPKAQPELPKYRPTLPDLATPGSPNAKLPPNHQSGSCGAVVPLPDPPANSCLKTGVPASRKESRSSSRVGLRVHFKLPEVEEDEESDASSQSHGDATQTSANKEPPPLLAKPKLDPAQLQLLHNQVLLEQQQETDPQPQPKTQPQSLPRSQLLPLSQPQSQPQIQIQTQVQPVTCSESVVWSPRMRPEPLQQPFQHYPNATVPQQPHLPVPSLATAPSSSKAPLLSTTSGPLLTTTPGPSLVSLSSAPQVNATSAPSLVSFSSGPQQTITPAPTLVSFSSAPQVNTTLAPQLVSFPSRPQQNITPLVSVPSGPQQHTKLGPPMASLSFAPQLKMAPPVTSPPAAPQLYTATASPLSIAPVTEMNTIHASHLNLSPAGLSRVMPMSQFSPPPAPQFSTAATDPRGLASLSKPPASEQITSPAAMLRSTHASLMNLAPTSQSFNYARPKEFIAAQTLSPVRSPSPTESPVPLLHELAAELNSSTASSPTLPPFSPPPRVFPTRVLRSPTSPTARLSSPTLTATPFLNSVFASRAQSPPQASSPASSSSTPSPIQNPVAFLSSVLPSLPITQPTNSMGLPRGAPAGLLKKLPKSRLSTAEDIRDSKEVLLRDIEKKMRLKDDPSRFGLQQKLSNEVKTASRTLGPNIPATVFNYDEEYRVSNFEQRLMSEIEFRLERTPVEESDDEVQHAAIPTGKCIAPIFCKKLKNYRAIEGVPVTFSCKIMGIPIPKVYWFKDGKQILRKNDHYQKIRDGDGTCALHIEFTTSDDDGNYTVMAANPQGRISCSGHLIVQTGPHRNRMTPIHSQRVRARILEVEEENEQTQERFFRPHFLQAPGDMVVHEGRLCRLDCKVSGLPNPELMWLVNGRPIYPDPNHKMLVRENGVHSLVIDPLTQNDAGTYTCIASNKAGQSSFCLELHVAEEAMKHPPQFVEKLQNTGIPEGNPVRLECRVVGMPPPVIFWKKDNDTIPKSKDRFSMHQDATGYVCLLIQPTKKGDAGWYTVSAKNEAGIVSCTSRLDIYAQWHQSIPAPAKKALRAGSCYAALTGQGLDVKSAFPASENSPILFSSSPPEARLESDEL